MRSTGSSRTATNTATAAATTKTNTVLRMVFAMRVRVRLRSSAARASAAEGSAAEDRVAADATAGAAAAARELTPPTFADWAFSDFRRESLAGRALLDARMSEESAWPLGCVRACRALRIDFAAIRIHALYPFPWSLAAVRSAVTGLAALNVRNVQVRSLLGFFEYAGEFQGCFRNGARFGNGDAPGFQFGILLRQFSAQALDLFALGQDNLQKLGSFELRKVFAFILRHRAYSHLAARQFHSPKHHRNTNLANPLEDSSAQFSLGTPLLR